MSLSPPVQIAVDDGFRNVIAAVNVPGPISVPNSFISAGCDLRNVLARNLRFCSGLSTFEIPMGLEYCWCLVNFSRGHMLGLCLLMLRDMVRGIEIQCKPA